MGGIAGRKIARAQKDRYHKW